MMEKWKKRCPVILYWDAVTFKSYPVTFFIVTLLLFKVTQLLLLQRYFLQLLNNFLLWRCYFLSYPVTLYCDAVTFWSYKVTFIATLVFFKVTQLLFYCDVFIVKRRLRKRWLQILVLRCPGSCRWTKCCGWPTPLSWKGKGVSGPLGQDSGTVL